MALAQDGMWPSSEQKSRCSGDPWASGGSRKGKGCVGSSHVPSFVQEIIVVCSAELWVLVSVNGTAEDFGYGNPNQKEEKLKKVFTD